VDAVLRVDLQLRIALFLADDFIHPGRAVAGFWAAIGFPIHGNGNRGIFQPQMGRLVFLVVGVGDKHRREAVETQYAVRLRIVDAGGGIGFHQRGIVGMRMVHGPGCVAAEDVGVDRGIHQTAEQAPFGEGWADVADFGQLLALAIDGRDIVIFIGNWNEYDLNLGNSRWKYKSLVITVDHDH